MMINIYIKLLLLIHIKYLLIIAEQENEIQKKIIFFPRWHIHLSVIPYNFMRIQGS